MGEGFGQWCNSSTAQREGTPELNSLNLETSLFLAISKGLTTLSLCLCLSVGPSKANPSN